MPPVTVQLFARARDLAQADSLRVELPVGATVATLRDQLAAGWPVLAGLLASSAFAVAGEYAQDTTAIAPNVEVAVIPPVSGG